MAGRALQRLNTCSLVEISGGPERACSTAHGKITSERERERRNRANAKALQASLGCDSTASVQETQPSLARSGLVTHSPICTRPISTSICTQQTPRFGCCVGLIQCHPISVRSHLQKEQQPADARCPKVVVRCRSTLA